MKRITVFGATGYHNVGDDVIGAIIHAMFELYLPDVEVNIVPQYKREEIEKSDLIIIGGGGLIYDYDPVNVTNYMELVLRAQEQVIPVYMMGIGVQHVFADKSKEIYRDALRFVKAITVRNDEDGRYMIDELHCKPEQIIFSRDLAFLGPELFGVHAAERNFDKPLLVASLADWKLGAKNYNRIDPELAKAQAAYLKYLHSDIGRLTEKYQVRLVSQAAEDQDLYEELIAKCPQIELVTFKGIEDSHELFNHFTAADVSITGRYHGLIAGLITETPTLGISFGGHKQQKLIRDSYPSLGNQLYTVQQMVQEDLFGKLLDDTFVSALRTPSVEEKRHVAALARKNYRIVKLIAGELAKS